MEALGAMENRLRACEALIRVNDSEQLQTILKKDENHHDSQMDIIVSAHTMLCLSVHSAERVNCWFIYIYI